MKKRGLSESCFLGCGGSGSAVSEVEDEGEEIILWLPAQVRLLRRPGRSCSSAFYNLPTVAGRSKRVGQAEASPRQRWDITPLLSLWTVLFAHLQSMYITSMAMILKVVDQYEISRLYTVWIHGLVLQVRVYHKGVRKSLSIEAPRSHLCRHSSSWEHQRYSFRIAGDELLRIRNSSSKMLRFLHCLPSHKSSSSCSNARSSRISEIFHLLKLKVALIDLTNLALRYV